MHRSLQVAGIVVISSLFLAAGSPAVLAQDPDWPCVQRLVPELAASQMWSGPPVGDVDRKPMADEVAALAQEIVQLAVPLETAREKVQAFAQRLPPEQRAETLTGLFRNALALINAERSKLLAGIKRYARGQRALAERITDETRELEALRRTAGDDAAEVADLRNTRDWDARIFSDRQKSLRLICEQPVNHEQRAFALARIIQEHLP